MKIAISGKWGVGKTTVCVHMAKYLSDQGRKVLLVDADPDANLASALGLTPDQEPEPVSELKELIHERTGASSTGGAVFRLNPDVSDIPEKYSTRLDNIHLLRLGNLSRGGAGCFCPEGAFLKALVNHLFLYQDEVVIIDMEAGIEHLGRASAQGVDVMLVVVEPGTRALMTAATVKRCAADIGVHRIAVVLNKYRSEEERDWLTRQLEGYCIAGSLPFDTEIAESDRKGRCAYSGSGPQRERMAELFSALTTLVSGE